MKRVRALPAARPENLMVKEISISATNESLRILNAPLAPVIIFFAAEYQSLFTKAGGLFTSCTLHATRFYFNVRPANLDALPKISVSSPSARHEPSFSPA